MVHDFDLTLGLSIDTFVKTNPGKVKRTPNFGEARMQRTGLGKVTEPKG